MGLAASQARLLTITARIDDIDRDLTMLSSNKLALARESASNSRKYQRAISAKKLTWDTSDGKEAMLDYNLLMHPSTANDNGLYYLTNSYGQVVLDNEYTQIMTNLGITNHNAGCLSGITQQNFVAGCMGISDPSSIASYFTEAGATPPADGSSDPTGWGTSYTLNDILSKLDTSDHTFVSEHDNYFWGHNTEGTEKQYFSSKDNDVIVISRREISGESDAGNRPEVRGYVEDTVRSIAEDVTSIMKGYFDKNTFSEETLGHIGDAADWAEAKTIEYYLGLYDNLNFNATDGVDAFNSCDDAEAKANNSNHLKIAHFPGQATRLFVDVSQVVATFLRFFDGACKDLQDDNQINDSAYSVSFYMPTGNGNEVELVKQSIPTDQFVKSKLSDSNAENGAFGTSDSNHDYSDAGSAEVTEDKVDSNDNDVADDYEVEYYTTLYEQINARGWVMDSNIDDRDYFQNQILYGNLYINQADSKGNLSVLSTSDSTSRVNEVDDEEAQEEAKAEYDAKEDEITAKELMLDQNIQKLDSERKKISTQKDSVESMIKDNIDRTLKIFDA